MANITDPNTSKRETLLQGLKHMLPYLGIAAACFYLLPLVIIDTGTAMLVLLVAMPAACLALAIVHGIRRGLCWLYAPAVALLFIPTLFIYYNVSAWIYSAAYGLVTLAGDAAGSLLFRKNA